MEIPLERRASYKEVTLVILVSLLITSTSEAETDKLKVEFYNRIGPKFHDRCHKIASKLYRGIPDWESKKDEVFQDTFLFVFEAIREFTIKEEWDDNECFKVLLFWMGEIANNKFLQITREVGEEKKAIEQYKKLQASEKQKGETLKRKTYKPTYDKTKFDLYWEKLNPMSKEILFYCLENGTLSEGNSEHISDKEIEFLKSKHEVDSCAIPKEMQKRLSENSFNEKNTEHLPDEVIEYLTSKYNVKSPAIRKAKQRALEGLRKCKI